MRNTTVRRLLAGTAAALCLAVGVGPAGATGSSYTLSVGGSSVPGAHGITATSAQVHWASPTLTWGCSSATVPSTPPSSVQGGVAVTDLVRLSKVSFVGCVFPGGAMATTSAGQWVFHGSGDASATSTDVVDGHLDDISLTWQNAVCSITVTGSASASFHESTQRLLVDETGFTGTLLVSRAIGCLGQVRTGQAIDVRAAFNVTSPDGAINIS